MEGGSNESSRVAIAFCWGQRCQAAAILEKLSDRDSLILLDDKARQFSSEEFAVQLNKLFNSGKSKIVMVLTGGAYGFDESLQKRAFMKL
jgi:23S rRNA (pseudouridine1915-N3)-methyltransferase